MDHAADVVPEGQGEGGVKVWVGLEDAEADIARLREILAKMRVHAHLTSNGYLLGLVDAALAVAAPERPREERG